MSEVFCPGKWQPIAANFLRDNQRGELVADMGMRKTSTVYMALDVLMIGGSNFFPALVIAPKGVADSVWTDEQAKWDRFAGLKVRRVLGKQTQRMAALKLTPLADVYVINVENVEWLVEVLGDKWPFRIVIIDECDFLSGFRLNKGGSRAAALAKIAKFTGRWWNLTGTPGTPEKWWGQMWFVDFGAALGRTYGQFKAQYFLENPYTHRLTLQDGAEAAIHKAVEGKLVSFRSEDWLKLEKPHVVIKEVDLPPAVKKQYEAMEADYFMSLDDGEIEAGTAAVKSMKCLQMASGCVYDDAKTVHHLHDAKIAALEEIVKGCGEPLLIGYWWQFDVEQILKRFPKFRVYSGPQDKDDWNAGKLEGMLLHPKSGGHGLSLQYGGRDLAMYSYYWNATLWQQIIGRIGPERQAASGFKRVVRVWPIVARGTLDVDVIDSNNGKITQEQALKRARARRNML